MNLDEFYIHTTLIQSIFIIPKSSLCPASVNPKAPSMQLLIWFIIASINFTYSKLCRWNYPLCKPSFNRHPLIHYLLFLVFKEFLLWTSTESYHMLSLSSRLSFFSTFNALMWWISFTGFLIFNHFYIRDTTAN